MSRRPTVEQHKPLSAEAFLILQDQLASIQHNTITMVEQALVNKEYELALGYCEQLVGNSIDPIFYALIKTTVETTLKANRANLASKLLLNLAEAHHVQACQELVIPFFHSLLQAEQNNELLHKLAEALLEIPAAKPAILEYFDLMLAPNTNIYAKVYFVNFLRETFKRPEYRQKNSQVVNKLMKKTDLATLGLFVPFAFKQANSFRLGVKILKFLIKENAPKLPWESVNELLPHPDCWPLAKQILEKQVARREWSTVRIMFFWFAQYSEGLSLFGWLNQELKKAGETVFAVELAHTFVSNYQNHLQEWPSDTGTSASTQKIPLIEQKLAQTTFPGAHRLAPFLRQHHTDHVEVTVPISGAQQLYLNTIAQTVDKELLYKKDFANFYQAQRQVTNTAQQEGQRRPEIPGLSLTKWILSEYATLGITEELTESLLKEALKVPDRKSELADRRVLFHLLRLEEPRVHRIVVRWLGRSDIPFRMFEFFARILIEQNVFPETLKLYLKPTLHGFFIKILAEQSFALRQVLEIVTNLNIPIEKPKEQATLLAAIKDLGSFGPLLYKLYKKSKPEARKELSKNIQALKEQFFSNTSQDTLKSNIKIGTKKERDQVFVELAMTAYQPKDMDSAGAHALMTKIQDSYLTQRFARQWKFPKEGVALAFTKQALLLKPDQQENPLPFVTSVLEDEQHPHELPSKTSIELATQIIDLDTKLQSILQTLSGVSSTERITKLAECKTLTNQILAATIQLLRTTNVLDGATYYLGMDRYNLLRELQKVVDGSSDKPANGAEFRPGILYADRFTSALRAAQIPDSTIDQVDHIILGILKSEALAISKELKKYQLQDSAEELVGNYKAIMTHSAQSFLARARMDVCTDHDTHYFNHDHNWHLDIIDLDKQTLEGNVFCHNFHFAETFLLRQFNAIDLLNSGALAASSFCNQVLKLAVEFARQNNFKYIGLPPNGEYHLLSNDSRMASYLTNTYCLQKYLFKLSGITHVSSDYTITEMYRIPVEELAVMLGLEPKAEKVTTSV